MPRLDATARLHKIRELSRTHTLAQIAKQGYTHSEVTEALLVPDARTPNGYSRRWVDAINYGLAERGIAVHVQDIDVDLWDRYIESLLDAIEGRG